MSTATQNTGIATFGAETDLDRQTAMSNAWFIAQCLLSYAVLLVLLPVLAPLLPFLVVFYILKIAERLVVKITSGGYHLTGMDAAMLPNKKENPLILNVLFCFENHGGIDDLVNNFRQAFLERIVYIKNPNGELIFRRLRSYIRPGWFQYFFEEDQYFNIENHVFKWEGEVPHSKDELAEIVATLSDEPLPEGRSPWYFCCIPTAFGDNDIMPFFRMMHSVADGVSLIKSITHKFSDQVNPENGPQKFSSVGRSLLLAKAAFIAPLYLLKAPLTPADRSLLHGPKLSGVKKVAWDETFNLQLIKDIKSATRTTVNDVLMSCFVLAVRRYFQRKGVENPDDITASVAIDVRSSASSKEFVFENNFTFIFPKLAVGTEGVLKQLYETRARMKEVKVSGEPLAAASVMFLMQELCPVFFSSKVGSLVSNKATCVLSNVPGPQHLCSVKGSRMKYMIFFPPNKDQTGVGLAIFSYAGKVVVGVIGDVSVLPDPEIIVEEYGNIVNEMASCVLHDKGSVKN